MKLIVQVSPMTAHTLFRLSTLAQSFHRGRGQLTCEKFYFTLPPPFTLVRSGWRKHLRLSEGHGQGKVKNSWSPKYLPLFTSFLS